MGVGRLCEDVGALFLVRAYNEQDVDSRTRPMNASRPGNDCMTERGSGGRGAFLIRCYRTGPACSSVLTVVYPIFEYIANRL